MAAAQAPSGTGNGRTVEAGGPRTGLGSRARRAVHEASGNRLGDAHPRQEGPVDLRLVPPALAAWATAALTLDASPGWVGALALGCLLAAGVLLRAGRRGTGVERHSRLRGGRPAAGRGVGDLGGRDVRDLGGQGSRRSGAQGGGRSCGAPEGGGTGGPEDGSSGGPKGRSSGAPESRRSGGSSGQAPGGPGVWPKPAVAGVLLCVAAAAASAGLHGADLRRGPVPVLAREYATVTAEVEITADPRLTRPRVRGDHVTPDSVLIEGEVRSVQEAAGQTVATRTPVLMIVDGNGNGNGNVGAGAESADGQMGGVQAAKGGPGGSPWLGLLPSTRVRVTGRLAPAMTQGDRIAAVLRVRDRAAPSVVEEPSAAQRTAGRLRAGLREATDGLPADARALLPGLVVGDTARIPPELDEAFKETDLAHTLAVSGSNLTIILALLLGPPGLAQHIERRGLAPRLGISLRATALLGGALTLGFVIVCRPDPSVLRAAACGAVVLLALATGRRRSLIPALATAVLLLVLYDPWLARSYGFLLSVLATGALLTLAPRWSAALRRHRVPPRLAEALAAAGAAQALCAPVVAVLSARVSLVAVPCNLLVEFAVAPATVLGFAALATAPVLMPVAKGLAWCASWPAEWIAGVARSGAALPGGGVDWPGGWGGALLLALGTAGLVLLGKRLLRHPWLCGLGGVLLLLVVVQPPPLTRVITGWPPPGWRLAMCDVGQGDATVLAAGDGAGVVVDAGPDPALVDRCLRTLGITRVPLVVLTHFHADHVAGLPGVLRGRAVGAIETTGFEEPVDQVEFVRREAEARKVPVVRAVAGERRRIGDDLDWEVLWPPPRPTLEPDGPNDASVTLLVRSAGLRMLLLGDLEPPAQRALSRSPAAARLSGVDVLKVAHHGSAYQDPDLIRAVAPRLALISCGADNPYGHPAPSTVAALRAGGAVVLRTDRDGALAVSGAGGALRVARD
ncbi:ComEC/Rec2 family competence protein [Streptomyces sp. NBC_01275]|uniref:ComEC/Rec2 family competence protein n=1 Tax=Streptomyces sp. NBC_01275 TaxID=2903807 RepID=UPI002253562A|nr:ComEC/Rec2 family competence protein [Streptomyces sp. NBC_01275]MCX4762092.1 ComEC/Rec2 family competence protein [Streptomyces sp. NBC_01275]